MSPVLIAIASTLLADPAASATVFRPPVTVDGELSAAEIQTVAARVDSEFERTDFSSTRPSDPAACVTAQCWQTQARAEGSQYIATVSLEVADADQALGITIVDLADGTVVAAVERTCELCGRDELLDATSDLSATAVRKLVSYASVATTLVLDSVPQGAGVRVDGETVGITPLRIEVSPGSHTVELAADGHEAFSQSFDLDRGTTESARLRLLPIAPPTPTPLPPADAQPLRRRGRVMAGGILLGGGLAAVGTGAALLILHGRPITSDCSGENIDPNGNCQFLHDTRTGGIAGLVAGGAALIGGATLLGLEFRRARPGAVSLSPTRSGLLVRGRF